MTHELPALPYARDALVSRTPVDVWEHADYTDNRNPRPE